MNKMLIALGILILANPSFAGVVFSTPFYGGEQFSIVPAFEGDAQFSGTTTDGSIYYDAATGQGAFDLAANVEPFGLVQLYNTSITTNTDGSLHLDGLVRFGDPSATGYHVFGDMAIDYYYDWESDYTVFTFSPIALPGLDHAGLFMPGGPLAGHLLDFEVTSTFLASVDNPFPSYTPVPLPAAFWLLVSGISLLLLGGDRRCQHQWGRIPLVGRSR